MIKILGYNYKIRCVLPTDHLEGFGRQDAKRQVFQLANNLHSEQLVSTILHEILEALNYHLELKIDHNKLMALEAGLYQVLSDNGISLKPLADLVDDNP